MRAILSLLVCLFLVNVCLTMPDFSLNVSPNDRNSVPIPIEDDFKPIRIKIDTTEYDELIAKGVSTTQAKQIKFAKEVFLPAAKEYLEKFLLVRRLKEPITFRTWKDKKPYYECEVSQRFSPHAFKHYLDNPKNNFDLLLFVGLGKYKAGYMAAPSFKNPVDGRPLVAAVGFKKAKWHNKDIRIFKYPRETAAVREHFNCSTAPGFIIKNHGFGMLYDQGYQVSGGAFSVLSKWDLIRIDDSGCYKANWEHASPILYGKNRGCDFLDNACLGDIKYPEFCNNGEEKKCSSDYLIYGKCSDNHGREFCKKPGVGYRSVLETCGSGSKCMETNATDDTHCFKYSCENNTEVTVQAFGKSLKCEYPGQKHVFEGTYKQSYKIYYGSAGRFTTRLKSTTGTVEVECPAEFDRFCVPLTAKCPKDCSKQGVCHMGTCYCSPQFTGEDCSVPQCPNECSGHGTCHENKCYCEEGWKGIDCSDY